MTTTRAKNARPYAPVPAGATTIGDWTLDHGTARGFRGTRRTVPRGLGTDTVDVDIIGDQDRGGRISRQVVIGGNIHLYADQALQFAQALIDAANEVVRLERAELGA
jgi:hypothetical protein